MRFNTPVAGSIASALPSSPVLLLFAGVLALSESMLPATALFAAAFISFAAGLVIATAIYRSRAPRLADPQQHGAPRDTQPITAGQ